MLHPRIHPAWLVAILIGVGLAALPVRAEVEPLLREKIEFKDAKGEEAFRLDPEGASVELQRRNGKRVATYQVDGARILVERKSGETAATIEAGAKRDRYTICRSDGKVDRILAREPDGDWRLTKADGTLLLKMKLRDDGFKIVDPKDREQGRVKVKDSKLSIRDGKGDEVLVVRKLIEPLAAAAFRLEGVPLHLQGAIALAILRWPPAPLEKKTDK